MTTENSTPNKDITTVLAEVASAFVGQFEMKGLLDQVIETTMDTLDAEVCSIFLQKDDDPSVIKCVAGSGFAKNIVGEAEYRFGEGLTGWVAKEGKSITIDSLEQLESEKKTKGWQGKHDHLQFQKGKSEFRNLLVVPLKIKDKVLGVIKAENKRGKDPFSDEDRRVFEIIANVIALAIENVRLQRQSEIQSRKDCRNT
jgi:GAF domain-containing protein